MKRGFVGTGTMTSAIANRLEFLVPDAASICLAPHNPVLAADLANRFLQVSVASSNQGVLSRFEHLGKAS